MAPELGQSSVVLAAVRYDSRSRVEDALQLVFGAPAQALKSGWEQRGVGAYSALPDGLTGRDTDGVDGQERKGKTEIKV